MMKISVIIPTYNEEKYIGSCLKSLKKQKIKPDEIIVVDNNCTDNTVLIANKYHVRIIKEEKQGMIAARNTGFDHATGDIIARIDADTILFPDWVAKIKKIFLDKKIDAVTGPIYFYNLPFRHLLSQLHILLIFKLLKLISGHETLFGSNMAMTRAIWHKIRNKICLDEKNTHEDFDLAIHVAKYGQIKYDSGLYALIRLRKTLKYAEYPWRLLKMIHSHHLFGLVKKK